MRNREIEKAQSLAKRLLDTRPDEGRAVRPRTDSEVDEVVSEQEQPSLRGEESPVHNVLSFTETESPVSVVVDTLYDSWTLLHCNAHLVQPYRRFSDWKKFGPSVRRVLRAAAEVTLPSSQPRLGTAFVVEMVRLTTNHYRQYPVEGSLRCMSPVAAASLGK